MEKNKSDRKSYLGWKDRSLGAAQSPFITR